MENLNDTFNLIIILLLGGISGMAGFSLFWIKHYIKSNDADHRKLFELIERLTEKLLTKRG